MRRALGIATLAGLAACADGPSTADGGTSDTAAAPAAVYADLHLEYLERGKPARRADYHQRAALCDQAGLSGGRLSDEEIARIGTGRAQVWTTATRSAVRLETFEWIVGDVESGTRCDFTTRVDGVHSHVDRNALTTLDLRTGKTTVTPSPAAYLWQRRPADHSAPHDGAQVNRNGVPCIEYPLSYPRPSGAGGTFCIWSAGASSGYATTGTALSRVDSPTALLSGLVVEQTPNDAGTGIRVTLRELVESDEIPDARMRAEVASGHQNTSSR